MSTKKKARRKPRRNARTILASLTATQEFTPKEDRFVDEYLIDLNATKAAERAGYSVRTAKQIGYELLCKPHIQAAIEAAMRARAARTQVTQDRILSGVAELAYYDIADLFDETGAMRKVHELSPALRNAIAGIEVTELLAGEDARIIGYLKKVKLADRKSSLELLGRHLKLFSERVEIGGPNGGPLKVEVVYSHE